MTDNRSSYMIFGGLACALALLIYLVGGSGNAVLNNSTIGTNGLAYWLEEQGIETSRLTRRGALHEDDIALRILPLYDTNLHDWSDFYTGSREEQREQTTQSDIGHYVAVNKINSVPTLIALPKWRTGVLDLDLLHAQLLIPLDEAARPLQQLETPKLDLIRPDQNLLASSDGITLYRPQLFSIGSVKGDCRPIVSLDDGILIAECKTFENRPHYILSDPDILNNHGLSLGNNASFVAEIVQELAASDGIVFIDTTSQLVLTSNDRDNAPAEPRSADELSRFLTYPFSLIYLGAGITFLFLLWRGLIRFGPPKRVETGQIKASKTASIEAKSYLLRLAGEDHALLGEYVNDKMLSLAHDVMGKQTAVDQPAFLKRIGKIDPENAALLSKSLDKLAQIGPETPTAELNRLIENFEDTYRSIRDELGHVSRRR